MSRDRHHGTPPTLAVMNAHGRHPFLLADGQPLSGKTRSMFEMVREIEPEPQMIILKAADLVAHAFNGQFDDLSPYIPYIVWLDDLSPGDLILLDLEVLDILTVHASIVGTITSRWLNLLSTDTTALTAPTRQILKTYVSPHHVPFIASDQERREAQALAPHIAIGPSIGASMVGGDAILRHYDYACRVFPAARMLAEVAVDIRRAGVHRGLSQRELYNVYAQASGLGYAAAREFAQAFEWLTTPPATAGDGILSSVDNDRWSAQSYLAGADDGDHGHPVREITPATWDVLLAEMRPDDAFHIAVAALLRGHRDVARKGFKRAHQSADAVLHFGAMRAAEDMERS